MPDDILTPPSVPAIDAEKIKAERDNALKEIEALKTKATKLDEIEAQKKKDADKKRVEEGEAKRLLEEKDAALAIAQKQIAEFEKRQIEKADKLFDELSEESKNAIADFKKKLSPSDWVDLVEKQSAIVNKQQSTGGNSMPIFTPGSKGNQKKEMSPKGQEIMSKIGKEAPNFGDVTIARAVENGEPKFTIPINRFVARLKTGRVFKVS